jgi:methionyl-tRNA formyltransferase
MNIVFLGINPAGEKLFDWLKYQDDVEIVEEITEKDELEVIEQLKPELAISSGFEHKVPKDIIDIPEKGIVNLHPSYLPFNRGSHPFIWPIVEDTVAGVSIHYMNEEIDEGPVIAKERVEIKPSDTAGELRERLMQRQFELFKENWKLIKNGVRGERQDLSMGNVHYRNDLEEVREIDLDEKMEVGELIDMLRGLTYGDEKLAYFEKKGERYYISVDIEEE